MKDQQTVQQFIELRARGISFAKIAQQLGVAKSTLVNWSREHRHLCAPAKQILKFHASEPLLSSDPMQSENHTDFGQFQTDSAPPNLSSNHATSGQVRTDSAINHPPAVRHRLGDGGSTINRPFATRKHNLGKEKVKK